MYREASLRVAVEFDLYSDRKQDVVTVRLCDEAPLFSLAVPSENYEPRLITPILLGTAISAQNYGQPMRALENQGTIEFLLDPAYATEIFAEDLHWIGREFRAYEGRPTGRAFVEDLDLVFRGRITDVTHDTKRATVRTGDTSVDLDVPLIAELYPAEALASIAGRPKPDLWGTVFCVEPVLEDDANLVYRLSRRRSVIRTVREVRVGGIAWPQASGPIPGAGEWSADLLNSTIRLGSVTLGGDVRCDVDGLPTRGLGDLATQVIAGFGIEADQDALTRMDNESALDVGLYVRDPVNVLDVLDDIFTGAAAWWGITPAGLLTAGFLRGPAETPDIATQLSDIIDNVKSASLSRSLPPAWRVVCEFERHWQTEGQFFDGVEESAKQRWSASGLKATREDGALKIAEPRAIDVPTMRSVAITASNGNMITDRFWAAWSVRRIVAEFVAWIDPKEIQLYGTIGVDYMMFKGNYRVISAVRSIGGGPAQLQLWG